MPLPTEVDGEDESLVVVVVVGELEGVGRRAPRWQELGKTLLE
jgi:hypothetical protein